jgi:hypothetical protein
MVEVHETLRWGIGVSSEGPAKGAIEGEEPSDDQWWRIRLGGTLMAAPWVTAFRRVEGVVAKPLERFAQSEPAIDAMIRLLAFQGDARRLAERTLSAYLHALNIPALTDIRRLSRQMALLERRVRELSREVDNA